LLWLFAAILFVLTLVHFRSYSSTVANYGDNGSYLQAANAIRHWNFKGVEVKQFWGVSYLIAAISWLPISPQWCLLVICTVSSLASVLMAWQLWGPWIAGFFTLLNFVWLQVSLLGGSESLFVALLFASFLAIRKDRWAAGSILAALATTVRPLGILGLFGIGLALISLRNYKKAVLCAILSTAIGVLYLLPFWIYFHDPLYQLHRYKQTDWNSESVIGLPLHAIVVSLLHNREPWTNVVLTTGWVAVAVAGLCAMARKTFRPYIREHRAECTFAFLYLGFILTYNSVEWARAEFPRFVIPVMPFLLLSFDRWLPRSRCVLYGLCIVSPVLAAFSAIGIRNVLPALR